MKDKITILIDESGTLPDPNNPVVVIAAVGTSFPEKLGKVSQIVRKSTSGVKKRLAEIKFYTSGEKTKRNFLKEISKQNIKIFVLIVEKGQQKIPDSPENYAVLCWLLVGDCLSMYPECLYTIIFDRHFHRRQDQGKFDGVLKSLLRQEVHLKHLDSQRNPVVNAADMVAGSVLWAETGKDRQFYSLIKGKIISERKLHWKEARRRFVAIKKLARTGASTHPEQDLG